MKNGKRPTRKQKNLIEAAGYKPENWLVVKDLGNTLHIVSRVSLKKHGSAAAHKIKVLEKV